MVERTDGWDDKEIGRPSVLRLGGAWWMWYAGCSSRFERAIGLAHSADGVAWQRFGPGPVLAPTSRRLQPGHHSFSNPSVLHRDGRFLLVANAQGRGARQELVVAESADGVEWSAPVILQAGPTPAGFGAPWLVKREKVLHLFVPVLAVASDGGIRSAGIRHARSSDARAWEWDDPGDIAFAELNVDHPCVVTEGTAFVAWFGSYRDGRWEIVHSKSGDGIHWTEPEVVVPPGPPGGLDSAGAMAPCVARHGDAWVMWHLGSSRSSDGYRGYLLRSISTDGRCWRPDPVDPVFRPSHGRYLNPY